MNKLQKKLAGGGRASLAEITDLYQNGSTKDLQDCAQIIRSRFHHPKVATFLKMAIVNYTNICVAKCDYCAFYRLPHQKGTYLLSFEQITAKIDALLTLGGTMVAFNGGFHPGLKIFDYAELFGKVHSKYPDIGFYEMTIAEFMFSCKRSRLSYEEGALILQKAGTEWITGGGAEILVDSFRQRHSPGKYQVQDYYQAQ
ncbi:MAG: radical SAM protein, partial [Proteobacteria bacterium]|nr:radical SAM protein [Pseudomonadota bacterium]